MNKLVVANWKMNQKTKDIQGFLNTFNAKYSGKRKAWIAPQAIHLSLGLNLSSKIQWGAQNSSTENSGALTGELSPLSLKDLGASFVVIGHSERRSLFGEKDEILNKKTVRALENNLKVIFCIGETLEQREAGETFSVIKSQILAGLTGIDLTNVILAYEPVWAIGTGKTASPEQAQEVHAFIRQTLTENFSQSDTPLLYGGSVKPDNVESLFAQKDIDGALVGGASLKAHDFLALCGDI